MGKMSPVGGETKFNKAAMTNAKSGRMGPAPASGPGPETKANVAEAQNNGGDQGLAGAVAHLRSIG